MGVPASEVGYTPAMPRREDHEVHKDMWWHWGKKKSIWKGLKYLEVLALCPQSEAISDSGVRLLYT